MINLHYIKIVRYFPATSKVLDATLGPQNVLAAALGP